MKRLFAFTVFYLCCYNCYSQYNLVPNYSFEDSVLCPSQANRDVLPRPWYSPSVYGSSYYRNQNSCATYYQWGVPYNIYYDPAGNPDTSFQYAKTGQGYVVIEHSYDANLFPNGRAYLQIKLKDSLRSGKCYYCAFWASLINPVNRATNNIAMWLNRTAVFSDTIANPFGVGLISANPQVVNYGNPVIKDTQNWVKVNSIITAAGGERYLTIGNFKNDANTIVQVVNTGGQNRATYYIDDVFVIPLDSMQLKADAGPNKTIASGDSTFIGSLTNGLTNIIWRNSSGSIINTTAPGLYVRPTASTFYTLEQTVCGQYSKDTVQVTVNPPLPLKLLRFTATATGNKALLQWQTADEVNVSHYAVQRSSDGSRFKQVEKVQAVNQSVASYAYTDAMNENQPVWYYQLQMVDKDGHYTYSNVEKISITGAIAVCVYPNPAKGSISISGVGIRKVELLSIQGRLLSAAIASGSFITFSLANYSSGMYLVRITDTGNSQMIKKIVKQ